MTEKTFMCLGKVSLICIYKFYRDIKHHDLAVYTFPLVGY